MARLLASAAAQQTISHLRPRPLNLFALKASPKFVPRDQPCPKHEFRAVVAAPCDRQSGEATPDRPSKVRRKRKARRLREDATDKNTKGYRRIRMRFFCCFLLSVSAFPYSSWRQRNLGSFLFNDNQ